MLDLHQLHQSALYLHIAVGSCALILFWVPVFTRKGNLDHKRFGKYFAIAMYIVSFSGFTMASLDLLFPIAMHAAELDLSAQAVIDARVQVRSSAIFLLSLSILVLTNTRHGWLVILNKEDRSILRRPTHVALCSSLVAVGLTLFITGLNVGSMLFIIFGMLQMVAGLNNLRYIFRSEIRPKEWWIQHLNGLIGSGIGAYTAFAVLGGRSLFEGIFGDSFSDMAIILWVAPGLIGGIAIAILSRHYQKKFGGQWMIKRASLRSALFNS